MDNKSFESDDKPGQEVARLDEPKPDEEGQVTKMKYPRSIAFIVSNEFCERFNYYGMRTILVLYLTRKLFYDEDTATVIYHVFTSMVYFMCVLGAIVADSWLGKYRTILYLSFVYVAGSCIIALGAVPTLELPGVAFTILGLVLIAVGSGGIKPCVAAFGGDQFKLPEQAKQLGIFFSLFYFAINAGSLLSTSITPILREDVHCFGDEDCFSLAFGVPGALMATSIMIFVAGKFLYVIKEREGNMILKVSKCIGNALSTRRKEKKTNPQEHWLDYAIPIHGKKLVDETKIVLKVLLLYIPLPIFWALFDQQGSRWTFQATRMDGGIGSFTIKPDQVQVINPLLILIFIPLYDVAFYPLLSKLGIRRPLQKLAMGGILAGISFLISAGVELELEKTYPVLPASGQSHLRIFNGLDCPQTISSSLPALNNKVINSLDLYDSGIIDMPRETSYTLISTGDCGNFNGAIVLNSEKSLSIFMQQQWVGAAPGPVIIQEYEDDISKSRNGFPLVRVLANTQSGKKIVIRDSNGNERYSNVTDTNVLINMASETYEVVIDGVVAVNNNDDKTVELKLGGVYTIIVIEATPTNYIRSEIILTQPNSIHMLWLIPQYVVLTLGEVMYSVTGLEFSYSQAPPNMKSVLQGGWQLTVGVGNLIVAIVAEVKAFDSQASEFFLFAGLMFVDMLLFSLLAWRYKYVVPPKEWTDGVAAVEEDEPQPGISNGVGGDTKKKEGIDNITFKNDD